MSSFDPKVLQSCTNAWVDVQNALIQYYIHAFSSRDSYANQLLFWDNAFPNITIADSIAHFDRNARCAMTSIAMFFKEISQGHSPAEVLQYVKDVIDSCFAS